MQRNRWFIFRFFLGCLYQRVVIDFYEGNKFVLMVMDFVVLKDFLWYDCDYIERKVYYIVMKFWFGIDDFIQYFGFFYICS